MGLMVFLRSQTVSVDFNNTQDLSSKFSIYSGNGVYDFTNTSNGGLSGSSGSLLSSNSYNTNNIFIYNSTSFSILTPVSLSLYFKHSLNGSFGFPISLGIYSSSTSSPQWSALLQLNEVSRGTYSLTEKTTVNGSLLVSTGTAISNISLTDSTWYKMSASFGFESPSGLSINSFLEQSDNNGNITSLLGSSETLYLLSGFSRSTLVFAGFQTDGAPLASGVLALDNFYATSQAIPEASTVQFLFLLLVGVLFRKRSFFHFIK